ncbi:P-loop containing nucleoside triphosphate hydrolase protein [Cantharellus anzutake]|uniref:P-loop containing nucleoside triphosphate hydrolase protein n=1 Tax=Cantharellus anzutake TaxID=1750568 RepID=UPI001908A2C6|nr:P-loop containing nucleoside triphosphate hydrolase protein [Cantharellus anzutake]KAF8337940.1 P-loop containing nucleoside triphosphate hydrolase protein [Cantharellus anzutake]
MVELRQHYLFNAKDADLEFRSQKDAYLSAALHDRLRNPNAIDSLISDTTPRKLRKGGASSRATPIIAAPSSKSTSDLLEGSDTDQSEGIFGTMLDETPTSETLPAFNTVVRIRDMQLPKQWSGRTPKALLDDHVHRIDKYAAISYFSVGGASRAVRAGVSVRWITRKSQEWRMEEDGCYDHIQAEHFISVVALHGLSFDSPPGFAVGNTANNTSNTRGFPPVFRDLWNELENRRKSEYERTNRAIWATLRNLLGSRISTPGTTKDPKSVKPSAITIEANLDVRPRSLELYSDQLAMSFMTRQMSQSYQEMLAHRNTLPIAAYRGQILSTLEYAQVMVLSGETGCGKSTQVPSFILEDQLSRGKPCKICCTEPRRISAISLAQRVSRELGEPPGVVGTNASLVGYSIRLESNTSRSTRLAFVTNGIALRMLENGGTTGGKGMSLDEITHIIVDEVHERSIESDFLLIVLKSLLRQRSDLKVILMSATVDAEKISSYFEGCPIMQVPGRTFPVDVQFLEDAVELTKWSINEDSPYAKRAGARFNRHDRGAGFEWTEDSPDPEDDEEGTSTSASPLKLEKRYSSETKKTVDLFDERNIPYELIIRLLERICLQDPNYAHYSAAILVFMPGMNEIRRLLEMLSEHDEFGVEEFYRVYPLHSTISSENQSAVFDIPPPGVRKIVIATNIAETGITIPDVTCVIDSGRHREMRYDEKRQISRLDETFIAQSNATQRRGRAGRVQAGLCFHLFTKFRHDTLLADHPLPEMMRLSLSNLALRTKILKVDVGSSIEDVLSRALDPPSQVNIQRAVSALIEVKALTPSEGITPMGRLLSQMPTDVHLGKFLLLAALFGCLDPALTIAAALNSKSPFVTPFGFEAEADRAKLSFRIDNSDFLTIHAAFASWRRAYTSPSAARAFCRKNYLSYQNLQQIEELRQQFLAYLVDSTFVSVDRSFERELYRNRSSRGRIKFLQVPEELDRNSCDDNVVKAALAAGLYPKLLVVEESTGQLRTLTNNQSVSFHPSSINFRAKPKDFGVSHLCYFTLMHSKKLYAWETGPIDDLSLFLLCGEAEFKLFSNSAFIDRKIKYNLSPKTNLAVKVLRERTASILATQMRGKPLSLSQQKWKELALFVLGKLKIDADVTDISIALPPQIDIKY